jgi:uncharacterized membrane protein
MKFSTRQDIEAPIEFVFARAADFGAYERQALRRGFGIGRDDQLKAIGRGMRWKAQFPFRGKVRELRGELTRFDAPNSFLIQSVSGGVEADFDIEFLPLSRNRTRVTVGLELSPKTLSARLFVQSLKFAKRNLDKQFAKRVALFGGNIESRYERDAVSRA